MISIPMDDCLPLESLSDAGVRMLLASERARRQEAERDLAGIARQNERILALERENGELRRTMQVHQGLVTGLTEQNVLLRQQVATLQQEIQQLRGTARPPKHQPGPWPSETTKQDHEPTVRKKRDHRLNHGRQRMAQVDERIVHAVPQCPHCASQLIGGWVQRRVQVIELPVRQHANEIEHELDWT